MAQFRITDPTINADYGLFEATTALAALDRFAQRMGWNDYADYLAVGARYSGTRTLDASPVAVPMMLAA